MIATTSPSDGARSPDLASDDQATSLHSPLTRYFYSGWAFLIPYLGFYLLYYWRKWPANAFATSALGNGGYIPALLHVYWALHALHLGLIAWAVHNWWWHPKSPAFAVRSLQRESGTLLNPQYGRITETASRVAPWFLLALIFYIPGVYLEWPSDPWEHFRRITEWATLDTVGHHSAGYKSFYFFAYSFVGQIPALHQIFGLDVYSTGICLLLAWQYYLLAKTVGLDRRWAFLSVIVNVLTFGNACFSFYRYYTLATTLFAQIGAVALMRIAIKLAQDQRLSLSRFFADLKIKPLALSHFRPALDAIFTGLGLLALIVFSHIQGIAIAGLGVAGIIVWRVIEWRQSSLWWLLLGITFLNILIVYWHPRNPLIESYYRPAHWLNSWYGFNLLQWPSPAADRGLQILGGIGIINLVAAAALLSRNHVVSWLCITPVIGLCLPVIALPFTECLSSPNEIITFHRMLFAIPSGLALLVQLEIATTSARKIYPGMFKLLPWARSYGVAVASFIVFFFSPSMPYFNRSWHVFFKTPDDLSLKPIWTSIAQDIARKRPVDPPLVIGSAASTQLLMVQNKGKPYLYNRVYGHGFSPAEDLSIQLSVKNRSRIGNGEMLVISPQIFFTPYSFAALNSKHWYPQDAALAAAGFNQMNFVVQREHLPILYEKAETLRLFHLNPNDVR